MRRLQSVLDASGDAAVKFVVLFANPASRVRRLRYIHHIDVCSNAPVAAQSRAVAIRLRPDTAETMVRNLRARGFDATCEPL